MTTVAVAIQGEAGSFSHAAALQALGPDIRLVPCPTFEELFRAVEQREAARGAVPIENSLAGSVHENYDLLGTHALHVVAETQVRVRHCLIARPGTERAAIRRVASHPVALAQCRKFFANHTDVVPVPAYDTAGSVRDLMAGRVAADAAIASSLAAQLYGLRSSRKASRTTPRTTRAFSWWRASPLRPTWPGKPRSCSRFPTPPARFTGRSACSQRAGWTDEDRIATAGRAALGVCVLSGRGGRSASGRGRSAG